MEMFRNDIDFSILAQKWSKIVANVFFVFFGLRHSLLMDLGHNQQHNPIVHSGGVSRGRVRGCGCWR